MDLLRRSFQATMHDFPIDRILYTGRVGQDIQTTLLDMHCIIYILFAYRSMAYNQTNNSWRANSNRSCTPNRHRKLGELINSPGGFIVVALQPCVGGLKLHCGPSKIKTGYTHLDRGF